MPLRYAINISVVYVLYGSGEEQQQRSVTRTLQIFAQSTEHNV